MFKSVSGRCHRCHFACHERITLNLVFQDLYHLTPDTVKDPRPLWSKVLVYLVLLLELAQVIVASRDIYKALTDDSTPDEPLKKIYLGLTIPIFGGLSEPFFV